MERDRERERVTQIRWSDRQQTASWRDTWKADRKYPDGYVGGLQDQINRATDGQRHWDLDGQTSDVDRETLQSGANQWHEQMCSKCSWIKRNKISGV